MVCPLTVLTALAGAQAGHSAFVLDDASQGPLSGTFMARSRGTAQAEEARPRHFPHRIWAAGDFGGRTPHHAWLGLPDARLLLDDFEIAE